MAKAELDMATKSTKHPDDLVIDFSGDSISRRLTQKHSAKAVSGRIDLGSGFPRDQIWTFEDGRKSPIPHLPHHKVIRILDYLHQTKVVHRLRMQIALKALSNTYTTIRIHQLDAPASPGEPELIDSAYDQLRANARELFDLPASDFLLKYIPQYKHLLNRKVETL